MKQEVGADSPPRTSQPAPEFQPVRQSVSNSQVTTWVPRGFAVVHSEAPGTGLSQGCPTVGGAPEELAPKAVIDWLNGRAKGYTTVDGSEEVVATTWSTGKVGMTGTSYNGTLPVAAATTGVQGLEAIIPIAPNTSYYHYYRSNGLVRHPGGWLGEDIDFLYDFINSGDPARRETCNRLIRDGEFVRGRDRTSGDYNEFWASRDLLEKVGKIKAAVLMAHAFNDWNVVPEHSVRIYEALKGKVPLQAYFHQGGHGGAPPLVMMNKWFTRYLYGVENGVEKDPKAWIVREVDPAAVVAPPPPSPAGTPPPPRRGGPPTPPPTPYADYPNPAASLVTLRLGSGWRRARRAQPRGRPEAGDRKTRRRRAVQRRRAGEGRGVPESADLRDAGADGAGAHVRHVEDHAAAGVQQAGRESVGVARRPAVDGRSDQPGESHHARLGGSAESRGAEERRELQLARARHAARAGPVRHADVQPAARRPDHPGRQTHRPDDLLERPRLHALAAARAPS